MEFHTQQLVWAELADRPRWPGVIIDENEVGAERPASETNKEYVPIHLLAQSENMWIDQDLLLLYEANREQYHKGSEDPAFLKAVEEADEHLQKQKEDTQYIIAIKSKETKVKDEGEPEALVVDEKEKEKTEKETDYVGKDITDIFSSASKTEENISMCEEDSKNNVTSDINKDFHVQQIVWAKMMGHPHWPAVIIKEEDINAKRPSKKSNKVHYPVQFLGENTNGWIVDTYICPYEENKQKYCKGSKNQLFSKAISAADEYVRKQKGDPEYQVPIKLSKKRKKEESPAVTKKARKQDNGESPVVDKKNGDSSSKKSKKSLNGQTSVVAEKSGESSAKKSKKNLNGVSNKVEESNKNDMDTEINENGFDFFGIADIDKQFAVQELVWAKMMGHPYWPAVIIEESEVNTARPPKIHKQFYPVQFLGEYANAWVESKFICPYTENKDKYYECSKNQLFLQALDEADEYEEKRKEDSKYRIKIKQATDRYDQGDGNRPKKRRIKEEKSSDGDVTSSPNKKENAEDDNADNNMEYTEQQIVWAKMVGHPHWPAVIISEVEVDAAMPSSKSNKQYYPVVFLGDFTHAWVEKSHIHPYEKNIEKYSKSSKTQFFAQALGQANEHLRKQKEDSEYKIAFERSPKKRSGDTARRSKSSPKKVERSPKKINILVPPLTGEAFSKKTADKLKIGVVGTGMIGAEIVKVLVEAGYTVNMWNRTLAKCKQLEKELGKGEHLSVLLTARNVLVKSDVVFMCISDRQATKQMVENEFEASIDTENLLKSKGILMMTSIDTNESKEINDSITKKGGKYLELALQGGSEESSKESRVLLTAGDEALFHHCHPYFKAIDCTPLYFGSTIGNAIRINLAMQMIKGVSMAALSEAFNVVERCGIEKDKLIQIFNMSDIASPYLKSKTDFIDQNSFNSVQQPLKHMQNDLKMILDMADSVDHALPLANTANEIYKECIRENFGDYDVSAVYLKNKRKYF
uniref:Cytokine-like nuclear factor N-PAC n=1 Tax=Diabrotica virgifera virgifera TaxID=50390 RepID=A0A6P7G1Q4_DIAVI